MTNFNELFSELTERVEKLGLHTEEKGPVERSMRALKQEYERETKALFGELSDVNRKHAEVADKLELAVRARDNATAELHDAKTRVMEKFSRHGDFRRLVELAFAQNPAETSTILNYLGGSMLAGELRDRATVAAANQPELLFAANA